MRAWGAGEELAVAQEKLKLVEFELTRESEELRTAKKDLADIEEELAAVVDETTESFEKQVEEFIKLNEAADAFNQLNSDEDFSHSEVKEESLNDYLQSWRNSSELLIEYIRKNENVLGTNRSSKSILALGAMEAHINMAMQALKATEFDQWDLNSTKFIT